MADNALPRIPTLDYDPDTSEIIGAAFRSENVVGSAIQYAKNSRMFGASDPTPVNDDEINTAVNNAGLQQFVGHFTEVQTKGDLDNKLAHMSQQVQDKSILDKGGWTGFGAQFAAGMLDAPTLLPFGAAVRLGKLGTETLMTTASKLAVMSAIDAGTTEAALHLTQDLRTAEESGIAVGGSMLLSTVLGTGLARYLSKSHFDTLSKQMERDIPRIADGRADADVRLQIDHASDNVGRAIRGEVLSNDAPPRTVGPGDRTRAFMDENGIQPTKSLPDLPEGGMKSALIGNDGKLYDLTDTFGTHPAWMKAVDAAGDPNLSEDMAHLLHLTVSKQNGGVDIATGSQSALGQRQLRGIREAAKSYGIDARNLFFREDKSGGVEVVSFRNPPAAKSEGFKSLSSYVSAEQAARKAERAGTPPVDPELRQGLPNQRWDGQAEDYFTAFHGSPHDFSKFDFSKIGTGEGAQTFGRGGYVAENPRVAESYRDGIGTQVMKDGSAFDERNPAHWAADALARARGDRKAAAKLLTSEMTADMRVTEPAHYSYLLRARGLLNGDGKLPELRDSNLYEVRVRGRQEDFVDYDKSLADQSQKVRSFVERQFPDLVATGEPITGRDIAMLLRSDADHAAAKAAGIRGVRYLDQGSRAGGDGTRNYVVFDDGHLEIVSKNGKPLSADGSGYASTGREMIGSNGGPTTPLKRGAGGGGGDGGIPPPETPKGLGGPSEPPRGPFEVEMSPSEMAFANSGGAISATRGLARLFGGTPVLEMMNSTVPEARAWAMTVMELGGRTKGSYEGKVNPIAIQSRMAEYEGMRANMTRDFNAAYKGWRQGLDIMGKDYETFSRNVSQTLVRLNFDEVDPNVAKAAMAVRKVISEMYGRAVEQGLIRKDSWQPGEARNPFVDFNAARSAATDTEFDAKDAVDTFLAEIAKPVTRKAKGASKITNEEASRALLGPEDANMYGQLARDIQAGALALPSRDQSGFFKETGSRLARGGKTGERGLDYNVGIKVEFGKDGNLGDNLVARGGLINRRYTDRVAHEQEEFIRAESMAYLQDRDVQVNAARKFNAEEKAKARAEATAKGEDPDAAEFNTITDRNGDAKLWSELTPQAKKLRLMSALNHSKGSWEFIVHGTVKAGDARVMNLEASTGRSPLHRRNVLLSDEVLLRKGWIDDDALGIANHTVRQIASDVELARVFRRPMDGKGELQDAALKRPNAYWADGADPTTVPDLAMTVPRKVIGTKFDEAFAKLGSGPENDAARNRLITERALMLGGKDASGNTKEGLIDVVTDMVRGTHAITQNSTMAAQNLNALKNYSFATRMGANAVTNLSDLGAIISRHGFPNLLEHYAHRASGLMRSLADPEALANLATKWELPQDRVGAILAREARAAGIAVETDLMSRIASQMDVMDPFANAKAKDTAFQQVAHSMAQAGSKLYLINVVANSMRRASYGIYVDRVLRMAMEPGSIARHERDWLNDLGIGDDLLAGIRKEVTDSKGGVLDGGVWHADTEKWDNPRTRSLFYAAGMKDVNSANVSPRQTEKPMAFSNPIVNAMLQFWSFSFGATLRIMGQSAQRIINGTDGFNSDGTRAMLGVLAMVGAGMGTYALHNFASTWRQRQNGTLDPRDELPDFQDNWRQWLLQGFDRSGVAGVFSQIGTVADGLGVSPLHKIVRSYDAEPELTDPIKKYGRPQAIKNVLGPTAGLMDDLVTAGRGLAYGTTMSDEEVKRSHVRAIMRNTPFINAFYFKSLTKEALEHLADDVLMLPPDK